MDDANATSERSATPRWVKVLGIIAIVVVLSFVILMFAGGGRHGPSRHFRPRDSTNHAALRSGL